MKRLLGLLLLFSALIPSIARADVVTSLQSDVVVSRDNVVTVKETVTYDPQDAGHHGIFRFVPAQFNDAAGHTYYTRVTFLSVTDPQGRPYNIADQSIDRRQLYLKIGDPDITLTGPQKYIIRYQIAPLVVKADNFDRFTFNITGQQWNTPILNASATVRFDGADSVLGAKCYTGTSGSTEQNCAISKAGREVTTTTTRALPAGNGFTVDVALPSGSVTNYLIPDKVPPLTGRDKATLVILFISVVVGLIAAVRQIWFWLSDRRERKSQTVIPLYEAPDGLAPIQMSILESPRSDIADVTATLIDLAVRGNIKIEQTSPKKWYTNAKYTLTKLNQNNLASHEKKLIDALFDSAQMIDLSDLKNNPTWSMQVSLAIKHMRQTVGEELKQKGYYQTSPTFYVWVIRLALIPAGIVMAVVLGSLVIDGDNYSMAFAFAALALCAVGFSLTYVRTDRTLLGNKEWAKVQGFKWFLRVTEKDRLAFTDAPDKTPELFSKMLPYAVALKVEKEWAKQFEGIDVSRTVGVWYVGGNFGDFTPTAFASDLSSSFGGAVSSNFAGSSGGGSAGGGGGGGGGGGW